MRFRFAPATALLVLSVSTCRGADPALRYLSFLKGEAGDITTLVGRDRDGFVYVAGYTTRDDLPVTENAVRMTRAGDRDIFLLKIDPNFAGDASVVYGTYLGGAGVDTPRAMFVDPDGVVYLAGSTASSDFLLSDNAYQRTLAGDADVFVMKLKPTAGGTELMYSSYLGGEAFDSANALAVGPDGRICVAGETTSAGFPLVGGALQTGLSGARDAFVAVFDPALGGAQSAQYSSYFGGESSDVAAGVAVDRAGGIVLAGWTDSVFLPLAGDPLQTGNLGRRDAFVARIDPSLGPGGLTYSTYLGGSDLDIASRLAVDSSGRILVTGYTLSANFPVQPGRPYAGSGDLFLTVLDLTKSGPEALVYSSWYGGSGGEVPYGASSDGLGNFYVTGYTTSSDFPVTGTALQPATAGAADMFVVKLGAGGVGYATLLGSRANDVGYAVAASDAGRIAVAGVTAGASFPVSDTPARAAGAGRDGAVVAVFDHCSYSVPAGPLQVGADGGTAVLSISAAGGCAWTAAAGVDWISLGAPAGSGPADLTVTVAPNPSAEPRTATITVAGGSVEVRQAGKP